MKKESELVALVIAALEKSGVPYMLAGSFASFIYGLPRSTKDADFVIELIQPAFDQFIQDLDGILELDPQQHLETITWTRRFILKSASPAFKVELFIKDEDAHHQTQWERKIRGWSGHAQCHVWLPTAEDVIIQKIRWGRPQDRIDAQYVLSVQAEALDWAYIEHWCDQHGTRQLLEELRAAIPPL